MNSIKVVSQQPPAGRCTLYSRYAGAITEITGWPNRIVHCEHRDVHGEGFPSLWVGDVALQPTDGVILSHDDVCAHLQGVGIEDALVETLQPRLETILEDFVEKWAP